MPGFLLGFTTKSTQIQVENYKMTTIKTIKLLGPTRQKNLLHIFSSIALNIRNGKVVLIVTIFLLTSIVLWQVGG